VKARLTGGHGWPNVQRMALGDAATPVREEDSVLAALMRAPLDDLAESEDERRTVAMAKASHRMKSQAAISAAIEDRRKAE
jgi:hypothetical protein